MGRYFAAALCAVAVTGASFAQDEKQPPGGGRGGRAGGQFQFGRGGMGGGFGSAILRDLEMPQVQEELKLSADEKGNIPLLKEELAEGDKKFGESLQGVAREEMTAKIGERRAEVEKQIKEVLGEKYTRFHQIRLQLDGMFAAVSRDKEVQEKLNVTDDQKKELIEASRPPEGAGGRGGFRSFTPGDAPPSPEKMKELMEEGQKRMEEMQKRQNEAVEKVLSADQKSKWDELIGTKITYTRPKMQMQFGAGRGAPGGGGGNSGGGGRGRRGNRGGAEKGDNPPPAEEPAKKPPMMLNV